MSSIGIDALKWCDELATLTATPGQMERCYLTDQHRQANALVASWLQAADLPSWQDAAGNLWGRLPSDNPDAPVVILGSHLDTVPNGGIYDGILGVVLPLLVMIELKQQGISLPFHLDLVGFGDEEGSRFSSTLLGSRAVIGQWDPNWASIKDANGISMAEADRKSVV